MKIQATLLAGALLAGFAGGMMSSMMFGGRLALAQRTTSILSTGGLQVIDEYGNTRIRLGVFSSDEPGMIMYDRRGTVCAQYKARNMAVCDNSGVDRISVGVEGWDARPSLNLNNRDGSTLAALEIDSGTSGGSSLTFYDGARTVRLGLGTGDFLGGRGTKSGQQYTAVIFDDKGGMLWKAP